MELFKILEIIENLVKSDKIKADKLNRYMNHGNAKKDAKSSPYLLAHFIQNEPQIHEDLLKILENREKWEKNLGINAGNDIRENTAETPMTKFIKLNLSHQKSNAYKNKQLLQRKKDRDNVVKKRLGKGPR
ncbi:hypothetical protein V1387_18030 [Allomuricauda taeanensis]|uniref:hypothetical protein n=1 Tax=Flagellimonas taeanensis TaxID=1005926 RepID=UPI002E7AC9CA|nr:hypothetical protein [Allomuricauda taeanensis]MEE1964592.1 hypothetical protein [Allomuricauda taeanensis]